MKGVILDVDNLGPQDVDLPPITDLPLLWTVYGNTEPTELVERIAGAGVDVLTEEPPANGNPLLNPALSNLIVTPHSAWVAREARQRLITLAAGNLQSYLAGSSDNQVL
ncbi:NAD(P)-dependent oxidoreductase [Porticoccus sp.]|uniref:NAD(P)-dependent oxidoreductase n=1 Tax=Porticoccus sp. TaxID=2024853 RepID=UPI003F69FFBB